MKAVIMAGGFGTRLRPVTINIPKPMVPLVNKPLMVHIVELLKKYDLKEIVSILYFQPDCITNHFGDGSDYEVKMDYITAGQDLGTAGSVKNAEKLLNEPFLVISGDVVTDFDLNQAINFHREKKAMATIVLTRVTNPLAFGVVITDKEGRIVKFLEKPSWGEVFSDTVNTGIYILEPEIFNHIPPKQEFDFSKNLFPRMLEKDLPLYGYIADGYWRDIGEVPVYRRTNMDVLRGEVRVNIPGRKLDTIGKDIWIGEASKVAPSVRFSGGVVVGNNCTIKEDVFIENSVIGNNTVIDRRSVIRNSVLWENIYVGKEVQIESDIICSKTYIRDFARIHKNVIISENCRVGEASVLKPNIKVWPQKVVEAGATVTSSIIWGDKWNKTLFGPYGIEGLANVEVTPEFCSKIGAAYGASIGKGKFVCVSRDNHKVSRMLHRAMISGLLSSGINVHDLSTTPVPVARYHVRRLHDSGGVHTKMSLFNPNLVNMKFFNSQGLDISAADAKSLERLFFREDFIRATVKETGTISYLPRAVEYYRDGLLNFIDRKVISRLNIKAVIDYAYGSAALIFPSILGHLGCDVISLNAFMDESFITKTEEQYDQSQERLSTIVKSVHADIGIMFDTGAEKLTLVDEKGTLLPDDLALGLVSLLIMKHGPAGKIAVPVTASRNIETIAGELGREVIRTRSGYQEMMEVANRENVIFLGDGMGGFIFPQFQPSFDAMAASSKILELLAREKEPISKLTNVFPYPCTVRYQIPCSWEKKGMVMRTLIEHHKNDKVELQDGIKIFFDKNWVLLIPDSTRPFFNIYAEGENHEDSKRIAKVYINEVKNIVEQ